MKPTSGEIRVFPYSPFLYSALFCTILISETSIWNTSIVHLTLGIPWCWRLGRGSKSSERSHLVAMIPRLPKLALIVADAGYVGYDMMRTLIESNVRFLIRMSSTATFYTEQDTRLTRCREGIVATKSTCGCLPTWRIVGA